MTGALAGKVCAVTGGARGIGLAIARRFAAEGATVVLGDHRPGAGDEAAAALGATASALPLDVRDWSSVEAFYAGVIETAGRLDISVHNAGVNQIADSIDMTEQIWTEIVSTNLSGVFACCLHAARVMGDDGGAIINMASSAGVLPTLGRTPYVSAKAGVIAMTKALGAEWAPRKIRVNGIGPGWVATDLVAGAIAEGRLSEDAIRQRVPMDRLGTPEEIAELALFLADESRSSFFTGSTLYPDGGYLATGIRS